MCKLNYSISGGSAMADNDKLSQNGREESETEEKIIREMEAQKTENSAEEASVFSDLLHSIIGLINLPSLIFSIPLSPETPLPLSKFISTVSALSLTIGTGKSLLFCLFGLVIQNILFIPALLTMGVSSIKLYKAIVNDRRKENIKIEIARHSVISGLMLAMLVVSSVLECEVSVPLLKIGMNFLK